jgi:hypothetical protein
VHPWDRLHRRGIGDTLGKSGSVEVRLLLRWRDPWMPRTVLGAVRAGFDFRARAVGKKADAGPNAPLLKRVVRWPFRLEVARGRREVLRGEIPWAALEREALPRYVPMTYRLRSPAGASETLREVSALRLGRSDQALVHQWLRDRRARLQGDFAE